MTGVAFGGGKLEEAIKRIERVSVGREELKDEAGGKRKRRRDVHEEEDVEREFDDIKDEDDDDIEVEPDESDDIEVEDECPRARGNGRPLSAKEKIARVKAKSGR